MVYKFVLLSDEVDDFLREIHIDSEATFLELRDAIIKSVGYTEDMCSFLICDDDWERETEITLVEMDTASDVDSFVMDKVRLDEFLEDEGQKLMFVFDYMNERSFFMELKSIMTGKDLPVALCKVSKGAAPAQTLDGLFLDDETLAKKQGMGDLGIDDEFGDCDDYDDEELADLSDDISWE